MPSSFWETRKRRRTKIHVKKEISGSTGGRLNIFRRKGGKAEVFSLASCSCYLDSLSSEWDGFPFATLMISFSLFYFLSFFSPLSLKTPWRMKRNVWVDGA
jgi:hypothetical protein